VEDQLGDLLDPRHGDALALLHVVGELLSLFDDAPSTVEVRDWVQQFATFNERAAARDGYYVC
jgi:hypothetical protein